MRFILVDEILELDPGRSFRAVKTLAPDEDVFRDHFPGFAVVPGVLLTEMMAQAAGKCLDAERRPRGKAMLARIQSAAFRRWMLPGQTGLIAGTIESNREQYATAKGTVHVGVDSIASAELFFSFVPAESFATPYRDEVLEAFWRRCGLPT